MVRVCTNYLDKELNLIVTDVVYDSHRPSVIFFNGYLVEQ